MKVNAEGMFCSDPDLTKGQSVAKVSVLLIE